MVNGLSVNRVIFIVLTSANPQSNTSNSCKATGFGYCVDIRKLEVFKLLTSIFTLFFFSTIC